MKKGDCFLCPGEKCRTLYYLTDVDGDKCSALTIYINQNTIQAMEWEDEFELDFPEDIIMMPSSMYDTIKQLMLDCIDDMHKILWDEALDIEFEIEPNALYTDGSYIYRMTEIKEDRWHYKLFRIERENISYNWNGNENVDTTKRGKRPITDETLGKVQKRFEVLQDTIAQHLETSGRGMG